MLPSLHFRKPSDQIPSPSAALSRWLSSLTAIYLSHFTHDLLAKSFFESNGCRDQLSQALKSGKMTWKSKFG